jgi:hypothetical protein
LGYESLAALDVGGWVLVIFSAAREEAEIGIDERDLRQRRQAQHAADLLQQRAERNEVGIVCGQAELAEAAAGRKVLEVFRPGDRAGVEQVEDRASQRLVAGRAERGKLVAGSQMAE